MLSAYLKWLALQNTALLESTLFKPSSEHLSHLIKLNLKKLSCSIMALNLKQRKIDLQLLNRKKMKKTGLHIDLHGLL